MKTTDFLKALPLLPASWLSSLIQQNKPLPQRQQRAEQWAKSLLKTLGYPLTVKGVENIPLDETIYFVSNHQGTLDPVLVLASCPVHVAFISKKENEKMPIFGRWARNIGTIHFDRNSREGNVHMLRESSRQLNSGHNQPTLPKQPSFLSHCRMPTSLTERMTNPENLVSPMENQFHSVNMAGWTKQNLPPSYMPSFKAGLIFLQKKVIHKYHLLFLRQDGIVHQYPVHSPYSAHPHG